MNGDKPEDQMFYALEQVEDKLSEVADLHSRATSLLYDAACECKAVRALLAQLRQQLEQRFPYPQ